MTGDSTIYTFLLDRIAKAEAELEHERRLHGITARERNEWAQHCRTAERSCNEAREQYRKAIEERDEARREVDATKRDRQAPRFVIRLSNSLTEPNAEQSVSDRATDGAA